MVHSTRGTTHVSVSQAILDGLAPDGGLYVFDEIPKIDYKSLLEASYQDIAYMVFSRFLEDFPDHAIRRIVTECYASDLFVPAPVTMTHLHNHSYLNLYHGETLAFKDMALSVLPLLVEEAKRIHNITSPSIILTATSGDTGSAALAGFSKNPDNHVHVLYPNKGVSPFQERQMHQFAYQHCEVHPIEGNFDDCQTIVKQLFQSLDLKNTILISANSINIGRLIPQITYYVYSYIKLVQDAIIDAGDSINIIVPTGNFGNIYAAYIAKQMGLPFHQLIIASNQNNVLHDFFQTGTYSINRSLYQTISPSMDIIISSNLERYLYDVVGHRHQAILDMMNKLQTNNCIHLDIVKAQSTFESGMASEQDTLDTIASVYKEDHLLIDPHTAVARHVFEQYKSSYHTVIVSTASPYKFTDAMLDGLGINKSNSLKDNIQFLSKKDTSPLSKRVTMVEDSIITKHPIPLHEAYNTLLRKVATIDENQSTRN
jgi:threonine synthase